MIKTILYIVLLGLLVLCVCGRNWIPGVFYPKTTFGFKCINEDPPLSFSFASTQINDFKNYFIINTFTNKQYETIYIKKMVYEWEGNSGSFLRNGEYRKFWLRVVGPDAPEGWYYCTGEYSSFKFNPEKLFKGKKKGDKFKFYLTVVYSFDDEPENTQILEYDVEVEKGEYTSLWIGFDGF